MANFKNLNPKEQEVYVNEAMNLLEDVGYAVQGLWHISDVAQKHVEITHDEAILILNEALSSERVMEEIHTEINKIVESTFGKEATDEGLDIHHTMYEDEIVRMKLEKADKTAIQKKQQEKNDK